jgi:uncharacterized protein DUF397
MAVSDPLTATWRKSSRSPNGGNNCVEVACVDRVVLVRDSKAVPTGPELRFSAEAWAGFVEFAVASA